MSGGRTKIEGGWLGLLYNRCSTYTDDPVGEIERLARQALNDGNIDMRKYQVLQDRIPFSGFERKSQVEVGRKLEVTGQMVRRLEQSICNILSRNYLPEE